MQRKIGLQNAIQNLFPCGYAGHDLIYLSNNGAKKGGCAEEEKDAEDLPAAREPQRQRRTLHINRS